MTRRLDVLPTKSCATCGQTFQRVRRPNGKLETAQDWATRRFCSRSCAQWSRPAGEGPPCIACQSTRGESRSRGLCASCYWHARKNGTLIDYPPRNRPLADTIEDWLMLSREGYDRHQAAVRLGMTKPALDTAITRWKRRAVA